MNEYERLLYELVLNWKLRLVVSALFSMLGLSFLVSFMSGFFADLSLLDQTIVGVAVFIVMIPVYLIIADLPDIDEHTIATMLNERVPDFDHQADLILKPVDELDEKQLQKREQIASIYKQEKLYRHLPNRPITQAVILMLVCFMLTAGGYFLV